MHNQLLESEAFSLVPSLRAAPGEESHCCPTDEFSFSSRNATTLSQSPHLPVGSDASCPLVSRKALESPRRPGGKDSETSPTLREGWGWLLFGKLPDFLKVEPSPASWLSAQTYRSEMAHLFLTLVV